MVGRFRVLLYFVRSYDSHVGGLYEYRHRHHSGGDCCLKLGSLGVRYPGTHMSSPRFRAQSSGFDFHDPCMGYDGCGMNTPLSSGVQRGIDRYVSAQLVAGCAFRSCCHQYGVLMICGNGLVTIVSERLLVSLHLCQWSS